MNWPTINVIGSILAGIATIIGLGYIVWKEWPKIKER